MVVANEHFDNFDEWGNPTDNIFSLISRRIPKSRRDEKILADEWRPFAIEGGKARC